MFYKKFILLILLIFLFVCCDNQNQNEEVAINRNTKSVEEILISSSESQKEIPLDEKKLI